jgi:CPA1 family monovalent cation:H+ antiporter
LISAATRLQGIFFWDFLVYLIEGLVFLITGLQIRTVISAIASYSFSELAMAAAVVSAVVVVARFAWVYPAAYLPRWLIPALRRADPTPSWQFLFVLGFTGIRGVVSLAAALAIPYVKADGSPFPDRDLILFLTFCVIFVTLVGEGLTLPWVTRALGLAHAGRRERQEERNEEFRARRRALQAAIHELDRLTIDRQAPESVVRPIRVAQGDRLKLVDHRNDGDARHKKLVDLGDEIELSLIDAERNFINDLYRDGELKDEQRRHIERELDLRDANLANLRSSE